MKWEKARNSHGIWNLTSNHGRGDFSANVQRGNLASEGCGLPIWCFYAEVSIKGRTLMAPIFFSTDHEARAWCESLILPETQLEELGELA